jgi:hypothetical protein
MKVVFGLACVAVAFAIGCTANSNARNFGGTLEVPLKAGQKLVNATWKDQELWYLTRDFREGEKAETWNFHEKSQFGIYEGTVIFKESNPN